MKNSLLKNLTKIKARKIENSFLIEGFSLIETALKSKRLLLNHLIVTDRIFSRYQGFINGIGNEKIFFVTEEIIKKLSFTKTPQGIIASVTYNSSTLDSIDFKTIPLLLIIDGISDPGNLGSLIRTAEVFGVDALIILPDSCDVFSDKVIRASAGSLFHLPIIFCGYDEIIKYLNTKGFYNIITVPSDGCEIWRFNFNSPLAITLGNESRGISKPMMNSSVYRLTIPIKGNADSLNVAVAGSIILYEIAKQRNLLKCGK